MSAAVADRAPTDNRTEALAELVKDLADPYAWNWTRMVSRRDAADMVLEEMAKLGLIEHRHHRSGGAVWIFHGQLYGRTDGVRITTEGVEGNVCLPGKSPW